ncbi:MAG: cell division protein FtsZ [Schleiferiaceae bacterium]|jgi:cell division protein FtsZ
MMDDGLQFNLPKNRSSVIKVIGVGGGGSNAVNHMKNVGVNGVDFMVCNTDAQALYHSPVANKVQLGASLTEGLGAGADPEIGRQAAEESIGEIQNILETGTKMCFITAGMGGGTGTGAAPIIAKAARDMGILTVGIVTSPFGFEGKIRKAQAEEGIKAMREAVDSLIVINNDKLRQVYGDLGFRNAFSKADEVLAGAAKGIAEVITNHYTQNIDLRDAKTVLENSGSALFGTGEGTGSNRAEAAIGAALDSPLLNDNQIKGAQNVLLLLTSGGGEHEVTIDEIGEITDHIQREAGGNANVIMGIGAAEEEGSKITCTIIATGFPTGTRVLPTDKVEVVKYDLDTQESQVHTHEVVAAQEIIEESPAPVADTSERIVMDLGEAEEDEVAMPATLMEEAPEVEDEMDEAPEMEAAIELEETPEEMAHDELEVEATEEEEDPMMGFPQMPEEDHEERFEDTIESDTDLDDEPTVHVLEWDLEDEDEEAHESIISAEDASILPVIDDTEDEEFEELPVAEEKEEVEEAAEPTLAGGWDLFSTAHEPEEEEIELTFVDDEDNGEVSMELDTPTEEETPFDAPAPAARENNHGMVEAQAAPAMPEAMDAPIEEEETTFSLDEIEGDGFSLEIEETDTPRAEDKEAPEERDYDPFEMSLSDMPELKAKADLEVVESSFTLPSTEFDMQPEAAVDAVEVSTMEEDPDLKFEIKASEVVEELEEEAEASVEQAMDQPISQLPKRAAQELPNKIQERMNRLQKFGYRFKENLTEVERTPAYKRQGLDVDLEQKSGEKPSNLGVDSEGNIRTNNSFLHDNVD